MSESSNCNKIPCQLVAHIWRPETVTDAGVFGADSPVAFSNSLGPSRYRLICECSVFLLPGLIIEVWILCVMAVLTVFPNWILVYSVSHIAVDE
jgi:hypothetical protein